MIGNGSAPPTAAVVQFGPQAPGGPVRTGLNLVDFPTTCWYASGRALAVRRAAAPPDDRGREAAGYWWNRRLRHSVATAEIVHAGEELTTAHLYLLTAHQ